MEEAGGYVFANTLCFGVLLGLVMVVGPAQARTAPERAVTAKVASGKKSSARVPASATTKSCPETGCACEDLKAIAQSCNVATHAEYALLVQNLKLDQEEHRKSDVKACPYTTAAETCRAKSRKQITQKKTRGTPFKVSATRDLGNFGIELIENAHRNPRAPASR